MVTARAFVSRFNPNRTDPAVLEAIFVQREKLAQVWLERLRDSVLGGAKHHLLAVGPRGCGKSHLVTLLVHRLRRDPALAEHMLVARLPEDETTPSFWKFLLRILRALQAEYGEDFAPPPREKLERASDDRRSAFMTDYLLKRLAGRTLLMVVENLDDAMRGLKDEGQKRWRAFLQEHPVATTLATAQQPTEDLSDRDKPFFNFFQVQHLQPLSADEALSLLRKLADHGGKAELATFLGSPTGRARVRAIRHLAGGSHRIFIILSEFATRENLDDLLTGFEELLDELTPYYQERLRWLPDQQREIVEFLCRLPQTAPVKRIAGELFLSEQTAAAQLKSLKDKGYVMVQSVGRESRYELSEPLMRLCVEVKDPRRDPIRLVVEFLRVWYDRPSLERQLECLPIGAEMARRHFHAAIQASQSGVPDPVAVALNEDLVKARGTGNQEEVIRVLIELAASVDSADRCIVVAAELTNRGQFMEALTACERATELNPNSSVLWNNLGFVLSLLGRFECASASIDRALKVDPTNPAYWGNSGGILNELGRHSEAIAACERSISIDPKNANVWKHLGRAKIGLGQLVEAAEDFRHAMKLKPTYVEAFEGLAEALVLQGDWNEAERLFADRLKLPPVPGNWPKAGQWPDLIKAIFVASTDRQVWAYRVGRFVDLGSGAQALATLGNALVRSLDRRAYADASPEALEAWARVWQEVAQKHPDLSLATRLFSVGVRYIHTMDERVLLDLVQEERTILRDLFRLDATSA